MKKLLSALAIAGVLAAAACGQAEESKGATISVKDAMGTVKVKTPVKKVVALEWTYAEDLIALGVTPQGVADKAGYAQWLTAAPLPKGVKDVGTRQEPGIETLKVMKPDLIITDKQRSASNLDELKDIAPTLVFDLTRKDMTQTKEMTSTVRAIGKAVGKEDKAEQVVSTFEKKLADGKAKLAKAGKAGTPVALAQGFTDKGAPTMRMFTSRALMGQTIEGLGLTNAWKGKPDDWGFTTIGVEGLTSVRKAEFMYVADPKDNPYTGALKNNAIWKGLEFVEQDRVHALDPGTWCFGGPLSTGQAADEMVKALS